ncbi:MAG TPA: hypothetical protein VHZ99_02695 [Steroidobacteraceae bacterium]|nr:hypothetical protein [Steroidobacteraceae bacterium]
MDEPRWLEILDRHSRLLEGRLLSPGVDLKRAFVLAMLEHVDAGWRLEGFSSTSGAFFCRKDNDRRQVAIVHVEPGKHPGYGAAHLCDSPMR